MDRTSLKHDYGLFLSRKLSYRDVAAQFSAGTFVDEAARRALSCGYRLMEFNGNIYKIEWETSSADGKVIVHDTGFTAGDVE
jgi:hypothetical protein